MPATERAKSHSAQRKPWWRSIHPVWWGAGLVAILGITSFAFSPGRNAPAPSATVADGHPVADDTPFQSTAGQLSLADLRGSKVVIYFYEGVG